MSRKGVNLPETDLGGDIFTEKDLADIEFGASRDFDYVAMSFVQSAEDINKMRQILTSHGSKAKIIAKIETKKAVESDEAMEAIVEATDGIMIARGDMAIEAGNEVVPIVQRKLITFCRKHSKICIVATQMMSSMVDNPEPTRAEVSDVATAVLLGADAVMLSDETANGKYPIETIREMKKVILYTQNHSEIKKLDILPEGHYKNYDALSRAAVEIAEAINADVIVAATKTGATASAIAAQRPNIPIVTVTSDARVAGQLALTYANSAFVREYDENYAFDAVQDLKSSGYLKLPEGRDSLKVVLVSGLRDEEGGTNSIQIRKI
jgi:pyruvate kinase